MSCMLTWPGSCGLVFLPHEECYDPLGPELPEMADAVFHCLFPSGLLAMRYLKGQLLPGWRRAVAFISVYDTHLISINSKEYLSAP